MQQHQNTKDLLLNHLNQRFSIQQKSRQIIGGSKNFQVPRWAEPIKTVDGLKGVVEVSRQSSPDEEGDRSPIKDAMNVETGQPISSIGLYTQASVKSKAPPADDYRSSDKYKAKVDLTFSNVFQPKTSLLKISEKTISAYVNKRNERFYNRVTRQFMAKRSRQDIYQQMASDQQLAQAISRIG